MANARVTQQLREAQRRFCVGEAGLNSAPEVLTLAELASFLGLTRNSLSVNLWRYSVPHKRLGGRLLFPRQLVCEWLSNRIEERVWIDPYRNPSETAEFWVRAVMEPPPK